MAENRSGVLLIMVLKVVRSQGGGLTLMALNDININSRVPLNEVDRLTYRN